MKRSGILALWLILSLVSVVTSGCGYRVAATIQANAETTPVPTKLSWAAVPGPALSASAPETLSGLQTVSVPLATALSLYNWKWLSNPDQAAEADVLVRIWWMTDGPQYITERADPFYRPGLSFGTGIGFGSSEIYVLRTNNRISNQFLYYRLQEEQFMELGTGAYAPT